MINKENCELVRQIILDQPGRHDQELWLDLPPSMGDAFRPVEEIARYFTLPVPAEPENPADPVCMTTGCVAGIAALVTAPPGSQVKRIDSGSAVLMTPDGKKADVSEAGGKALGTSEDQADYLFCSMRTRGEVLAVLEYLQKHPAADWEELDVSCGGQDVPDDEE